MLLSWTTLHSSKLFYVAEILLERQRMRNACKNRRCQMHCRRI